MANNLIQIKRSLNTSNATSLANGELAFTSNGDVLWIGANGATIPIAGKRFPGVLTANQALVANASSGIDKIIVANAAISQLNVNGATGTAGFVLKSGGAGSNTYWEAPASVVAGSNSQVQFNANGSLAGDAGLTYDGVTDTLSVAGAVNVGANVSVNTTALDVGNTTFTTANAIFGGTLAVNGSIGSAGQVLTSGAGTNAYWTTPTTGTVTSVATGNGLTGGPITATGTISVVANNGIVANSTGVFAKAANGISVDASGINVTAGDGQVVNSTGVHILANTGVVANTTGLFVNATYITSLAANLASPAVLGSTTANGASLTYANVSGQVNTVTLYVTTSANIASVVQANSLGVFTTGTMNATSYSVGTAFTANSTVVNAVSYYSGTLLVANSTVSNATHLAGYTFAAPSIIGATTANGISLTYANVSGQVNTANLYAATSANIASVVQANSTGMFTTATANALNFTAGAGFGAASAGLTANSGAVGISTNTTVNAVATATYLQVANSTATSNLTAQGLAAGANVVANTTTLKVGATTLTTTNAVFGGTIAANGGVGTAGQVLISGGATNAYFGNSLGVFSFTDLTVSGNLSVLGDLVSLNVSTLAIEDPLFVLAKDQSNTATYTDAVDIGFFGSYGNTLVTSKNWTGFFRDQSDSGVYKLFSGNIPEPTTTVDTTNVNFTFATFQAQIKAGGATPGALLTNTSHVTITSNSTVNVFITANTLALSTALPATSGGTGKNTIAVGSLLIGNSTNTISELAAGTDGYVLQINGTGVVAWNTLDGGSF